MASVIEKLRSYRVFGLAVFDFVAGFIGLALLFLLARQMYFPKLHWYAFVLAALYATFTVGMTVHILLGINTQANYKLGLSYKP